MSRWRPRNSDQPPTFRGLPFTERHTTARQNAPAFFVRRDTGCTRSIASFITAAPSPRYPKLPGLTPTSYYESFTFLLFSVIHTLAARESRHYPYPSLAHELAEEVQAQLPFPLTPATNDGVVPTLSQIWGRLGGVYVADHLDVTGQYSHVLGDSRVEGWLHSRAHFDDERFEVVWADIAETIIAAAAAGPGSAQLLTPPDPEVTIDLREGTSTTAQSQ